MYSYWPRLEGCRWVGEFVGGGGVRGLIIYGTQELRTRPPFSYADIGCQFSPLGLWETLALSDAFLSLSHVPVTDTVLKISHVFVNKGLTIPNTFRFQAG